MKINKCIFYLLVLSNNQRVLEYKSVEDHQSVKITNIRI